MNNRKKQKNVESRLSSKASDSEKLTGQDQNFSSSIAHKSTSVNTRKKSKRLEKEEGASLAVDILVKKQEGASSSSSFEKWASQLKTRITRLEKRVEVIKAIMFGDNCTKQNYKGSERAV